MSLVSIIIPYFKKKNYIQQTFNSILKQEYKNFEILFIYDDENQNDLTLLKEMKKKDKRLKIIINKKNIGAGMSRNRAIKASKGKYIAFLDADDLWHPDKLKKQIDYMEKKKIKITHTSYYIINKENKKIGFREAKKINYSALTKSCDIGLSTVVVKKSLLKNNLFSKLKTKEDYVLWLKLTKKNEFYPIKIPLTYWRKLDNSLSSSLIQKLIDGYCVYRVYLKQSIIKSFLSLFILSINFLRK
jgi:teichuronic acid biosynthesis glycosyltransferase TuaG